MRLCDDGVGTDDKIKLVLSVISYQSVCEQKLKASMLQVKKKSHELKKGLIKCINIQLIYILIHTKPLSTNAWVIKDTWR